VKLEAISASDTVILSQYVVNDSDNIGTQFSLKGIHFFSILIIIAVQERYAGLTSRCIV